MRSASSRRPRAHDVAIYSPWASAHYGAPTAQTGGAELQTTLLAAELAKRGLRVAHIVYQVDSPRPLGPAGPTLVMRPPWQRGHRHLGEVAESGAIWRALRQADAEVYVVRGSGGHVPVAAGFCRVMRRRFVFASSSELDFDFSRPQETAWVLRAYKASLRLANRVVLQTRDQARLSERALPRLDPIVIPSFAQPAEPAGQGDHFLWANRAVDYKLPERYLELAARLPEARFRMVLGATSETPRGLLEKTRASAALLPNVELLDKLRRDDLLADMKSATALVTTSRVEGMPNTFLEAWSRAVPVLSLHVDPDDRIADHGLGAVAGGSMDRLVEEATAFWRDPDLRRAAGERARQFVRDTHGPEVVADSWLQLVEGLIRPDAQRPN